MATSPCISLLTLSLHLLPDFTRCLGTCLSLLMINMHFSPVCTSEGDPWAIPLPGLHDAQAERLGMLEASASSGPRASCSFTGSGGSVSLWRLPLRWPLWQQRVLSCDLAVRCLPLPRADMSSPWAASQGAPCPARYISIAPWGTAQNSLSLLTFSFFFLFFCLSRKEKEAWENSKRCFSLRIAECYLLWHF